MGAGMTESEWHQLPHFFSPRGARHKCATGQTVNLDSQIAMNLPTVAYLPTGRDEAAARDPRLLLLASRRELRRRRSLACRVQLHDAAVPPDRYCIES